MATAADKEMIQIFNYLKSCKSNLFHGIIEAFEEDDVIEKDGSKASKLRALAPKYKQKDRIIIGKRGPEEHSPITLVEFKEDDHNLLTFYHGTRYIDAEPSVVTLDTCDGDVPSTGLFKRKCLDDFCSKTNLINLEDLYIALCPGENPVLKSVPKDEIQTLRDSISTMITIFNAGKTNDGYDCALFFPNSEGSKIYHYYLYPRDSSAIGIDRIRVDNKKQDEVTELHYSHLFFRIDYHNPGGDKKIEEVDSDQAVHHVISDNTSDLDDSMTESTTAPITHKLSVHSKGYDGEMVNGYIGGKIHVEELDDIEKDSGTFSH